MADNLLEGSLLERQDQDGFYREVNKLSDLYQEQCCAKLQNVIDKHKSFTQQAEKEASAEVSLREKEIASFYNTRMIEINEAHGFIQNDVMSLLSSRGISIQLGSAQESDDDFTTLRAKVENTIKPLNKELGTLVSRVQSEKKSIGSSIGGSFAAFLPLWLVIGLVAWDSDKGFAGAIGLIVLYWAVKLSMLMLNSNSESSVRDSIADESTWLLSNNEYVLNSQIAEVEDKRDTMLRALERKREFNQCNMDALENDFRKNYTTLAKEVISYRTNLQVNLSKLPLEALPFSEQEWSTWTPPLGVIKYVRLGRWSTHGLDAIVSNAAKDIEPPLLLSTKSSRGLLINCGTPNRNQITADLALKFLMAHPAGHCRLLICDPNDAGEHVSGLFKLIDYDDRLINGKVWTNSAQISERIRELADHVELVIQQYLRNDFQSVEEYHAHIGEIVIPYNVIVLFGFPKAINEETLNDLVSIAKIGRRCGVSLIVCEGDQKSAYRLDDVSVITRELRQYDSLTKKKNYLRFVPDRPIDSVHCDQIVTKVGCIARENSNVIVDWESVISLFERNLANDPKKYPTIEFDFQEASTSEDQGLALPRWIGDSSSGLQAPIGRASATRSQLFAVGPIVRERSAHTMLVGKTGMGKSSILHALILSLTHLYSPDELELYLLDFKAGVEFKAYAKFRLPHARVVAIQSDRELGLSVLISLNAEIERRSNLFREAGVQDILAYRHKVGKTLSRILLIADEFQVIFGADDRVASDSDTQLENLVRQGRSFGIHILLASQSMNISASFSRDKIYDQMANRISLAVGDNDIDRVFGCDNRAAKDLSTPGEAIYNHKGGEVSGNSKFQAAYVTDEQKIECLKGIRKRFDQEFADNRTPYVFEGAVDVNYDEMEAVFAKSLKLMSVRNTAVRVLIGAPVSINPPIQVDLQRDMGNHLLFVGLDRRTNACLVTSVIRSVFMNNTVRDQHVVNVVLFNGVPKDDDGYLLEELCENIGDDHKTQIEEISTKPSDVESAINEIWSEIQRRNESATGVDNAILIVINRLQGLAKFRASSSDPYDIGLEADFNNETDSITIEKMIKGIMEDGPAVGVHFCILADSERVLRRSCFHRHSGDFNFKAIHSLNPDDANDVFGDHRVSAVDRDRVYMYDYHEDRMTKFKPLHSDSVD